MLAAESGSGMPNQPPLQQSNRVFLPNAGAGGALPLDLPPEIKNAIIQDRARASAERIRETLRQRYEDGVFATIIKPVGKDWLQWLTGVTDPIDMPALSELDWAKKVRLSQLPYPVSPFWQVMMLVPDIADLVQEEFRALYKRHMTPEAVA